MFPLLCDRAGPYDGCEVPMAQKTKKPGKKSRNVKTKRKLHKLMGDIFNALGMKRGDAGPLVMRNGG